SCGKWLATQKRIKRAIDILVSVAGLGLLFPLYVVLGLLIKLDSKGPVLFKQQRVGKDRRLFNIYKFRTMVQDAENKGKGYLIEKNDFRITRLGEFLRRYSLDETPQFLNIIRGQMSLVGPRPTLKYQVDQYTQRQLIRLKVRPGVTGLAQIQGRNELSWPERIEYDIKYIETWSLWRDFVIVLKTIGTVIGRKDIYTEDLSKFDVRDNT
ncbi:unnamed protein product, partial [marine sediment metagenome]